MRKWGIPLIVTALLIPLVWFTWSQPREPVCEGKNLSAWLNEYGYGYSTPPKPYVESAIRHTGANAVPFLLQKMEGHNATMKSRIYDFVISKKIKINLPQSWSYGDPYTQMRQARIGFKILGPEASNAVPGLIRLYHERNSVEAKCACLESLAAIGPSASQVVPDLLVATSNADMTISSTAIWALGEIHSQPELVVPALTKLLDSKVRWAHFHSSAALAKFGSDAKPALPTLMKFLDTNDLTMRMDASNARSRIDTAMMEKRKAGKF